MKLVEQLKPLNEQLDNIEENVVLVPKLIRGFAAMSKEQRTAIARKGGASVPAHKRAFSQDNELASKAGRAGGLIGHGGGRPKKVPEND